MAQRLCKRVGFGCDTVAVDLDIQAAATAVLQAGSGSGGAPTSSSSSSRLYVDLMTIAVGTDYWLYSRGVCKIKSVSENETSKKNEEVMTHSGLWRTCCLEAAPPSTPSPGKLAHTPEPGSVKTTAEGAIRPSADARTHARTSVREACAARGQMAPPLRGATPFAHSAVSRSDTRGNLKESARTKRRSSRASGQALFDPDGSCANRPPTSVVSGRTRG
ncbi:hypothetical protein SKAU_G00299560 [Synaphobranchus kaupii]|uniref:Uncharacterized protein n=1 Tax=Synaphobranchus kaupii TaxID=118154 RepID=A0A9Q1IN47_SYNKA|nr:hypothetical protein SKAU_G00299560 [Synaphobranchus kaupii]